MRRVHNNCILTALFLFISMTASAAFDYTQDTLHKRLYSDFLELYSSTGRDAEFYRSANALAKYYRDHDMASQYYKMQLNICLYDAENNQPDKAMERAKNMLQEMEAEHFDGYSQVYTALGTVYESRGNYRMAHHFYEKALEHLPADDNGSLMSIYSRLAYLMMFRNPVEAKRWNEKYYQESLTFPPYHQVYLFIDCMISFTLGDKRQFELSYEAYHNYRKQQEGLDNYGLETLEVAQQAFSGNYDEALQLLSQNSRNDLNIVNIYDARIIVQKMMNRLDLALQTAEKRSDCIDSLNHDMLYANLNEINAAAGVGQANAQASKARERVFIIGILLALVVIGTLVFWVHNFRKSREQLKKRNEQLRSALAMAEEGEKMKTEFVRSVSHEIRTPLNAINGFNDILNTPGIEISAEERTDLLARIADNIKAITNIVDEMLQMADKESNEFYDKTDRIYCNSFFSNLLYSHREHVSSSIELEYVPRVINRFQIETNEEGLRKVMEELIQNAIKFTSKGYIRVSCQLSDDNYQLLVSIEDSGRGIPKEEQEKIFEGFYKTNTFEQGIGLGLTVSKKIAQKLGGDLTLDTNYIGGARFVLSLPA